VWEIFSSFFSSPHLILIKRFVVVISFKYGFCSTWLFSCNLYSGSVSVLVFTNLYKADIILLLLCIVYYYKRLNQNGHNVFSFTEYSLCCVSIFVWLDTFFIRYRLCNCQRLSYMKISLSIFIKYYLYHTMLGHWRKCSCT